MSPLIVPAIVTLSLGRPEVGHDLHDKIRAAKKVGFPAIEISYFCLAAHAAERGKSLQEAARDTRALLDELSLEAVSLGPLMNFEVGERDGFIWRRVMLILLRESLIAQPILAG
jgi:sugar phosphate isomerase/epimerase